MKMNHVILAAMLAAFTTLPAVAAPMIQFVDNLDNSVTLQVVTDASGSLGAELGVAVEASGLTLTNATVNTALFDDANPGDNPFINGLDNPIGGDTTGLYVDFSQGQVFGAFGSQVVGIGTFDFLTLEFEGMGTLNASGVVAQQGLLGDVLEASIAVAEIPEPTTGMLALLGLAGCVIRRRVA